MTEEFQYTSTVRPLNLDDEGPSTMRRAPLQKIFLPLCGVVMIAGIGTGAGLNKILNKNTSKDVYNGQKIERVAGNNIADGQVFGTADEKTFNTNVEGYLQLGGIDGEGIAHLVRPGGVTQTVYLTSSITDLTKFDGMQVKVWGETFSGQKAGWLMDVGRVQVLSTKGKPPSN